MATATAYPEKAELAPKLPGRRYDHWFFTSMALAMLCTVFAGFARTYFLAGVFHAPLPNLLIHIHGAAFTAWILLLVAQTSLVSAGRVDVHRKLGLAGFFLGCLMIVLGIAAATNSLARNAHGVGADAALAFYIVPLTDILIFAVAMFFAYRDRRDPAAHKRYIYIATSALMIAAVARIPLPNSFRSLFIATLLSEIFLLVLVVYDLWSTHKVHRATLWAGGFLIFVQQIRLPISKTAVWHVFAAWVRTHAR
jgi:FtsH-binding integral membrane protein